jgi:hypothetical protein
MINSANPSGEPGEAQSRELVCENCCEKCCELVSAPLRHDSIPLRP